MESRASAQYVRMSPRKVRLVCDIVRGEDTKKALAILSATPKAAAEVIRKVLKSAIANAENNFGMDPDNLYISEIYADGGTIIKRYQPRAKGRGYRINKRTSHITIVVKDKEQEGAYGTES
ncbi:MAG: 50S ribosomal protein L22 [Clostridiales bacterium]|jgi:large subunit ribosomal protein L22|nr:50S ribosomal protein L22 [Clostridiales bacterium]